MATMASSAINSRQASSRSFSANGSPTCTARRFSCDASSTSACLGTHIDDGVPDALGRRLEDAVGIDQPHCHGVDEDIVVVARIEIGLAADRGHAHAVAVIADAGYHARNQMAGLGMAWRAES